MFIQTFNIKGGGRGKPGLSVKSFCVHTRLEGDIPFEGIWLNIQSWVGTPILITIPIVLPILTPIPILILIPIPIPILIPVPISILIPEMEKVDLSPQANFRVQKMSANSNSS